MTTFTHYTTLDNGEKVAQLPGYGKRTVVFSLDIGDVIIGDWLHIMGQFQASNESLLGLASLFGSNCILTGNPLDADMSVNDVPTGAVECVEANAYNLLRAVHHGVQTKVGLWKVTKALPKAYVNMVSWTSNSYNRVLTVDVDRGRLGVMKVRA